MQHWIPPTELQNHDFLGMWGGRLARRPDFGMPALRLTGVFLLGILSPCKSAQRGAAVVVSARRRVGSRKFSGPTRRNAGGFLVLRKAHPESAIALVP